MSKSNVNNSYAENVPIQPQVLIRMPKDIIHVQHIMRAL